MVSAGFCSKLLMGETVRHTLEKSIKVNKGKQTGIPKGNLGFPVNIKWSCGRKPEFPTENM